MGEIALFGAGVLVILGVVLAGVQRRVDADEPAPVRQTGTILTLGGALGLAVLLLVFAAVCIGFAPVLAPLARLGLALILGW